MSRRLGEWRQAAQRGHELGNHALFHPCDGSLPGRGLVTPDNDLSTYTVSRAVAEIRATNTLLTAIDGKTARTFAYPCGDQQIGGVNFYDQLKTDFVAAHGVTSGLQTPAQVQLDNVDCYGINGQDGQYLIDLVKQAQQAHTLLVFLFHGVGGGHPLNVDGRAPPAAALPQDPRTSYLYRPNGGGGRAHSGVSAGRPAAKGGRPVT